MADQLIRNLRQVQETTRPVEPERFPRDAAQRLAAVIEATQAGLDALHTRLDSA